MNIIKKAENDDHYQTMMIGLIFLGLVICTVAGFVLGCVYGKRAETNTETAAETVTEMKETFTKVADSVYRHEQTGVYYIATDFGGVCVVVNADGTPYTGMKDEHDNNGKN